jgi:hypothetical protein
MPTYQTASRIVAAVHRETSINVQATATGASQIRLIQSDGLELKRAKVQSAEKLSTGLRSMMRLGYKTVEGGFEQEISVGGANDMFVEAIQRSAWVTATAFAFASATTIALGTNTLTAAGGDFTAWVKVGDVFSFVGTSVSADNNINRMVRSVATLTLVFTTGAFTTLAASATGTMTRLKKVTSPTGAYTRYSHTIEQYDSDADVSELFTGNRLVGMKLSFQPGQMAKMTTQFMGVDRVIEGTATAVYFSSPSLTTSLGLVADDSSISYNGALVGTFTALELNLQITAQGQPTIGSLTTADIFDNDVVGTGSISMLRSDLSNATLFDGETEFELSMLLAEPSGSPPNAFAFYLPRVKLSALKAPVGGGDGAKVETLTFELGPKTADTTHDYGYATFSSSGA